MLVDDISAHVDEMLWNINLDWASFVTSSTKARRLRKIFEISQSLKKWRDQRTDWPRINAAVGMTADLAIDGAGIQTRAAANASQGLAILTGENFRASVVDQNQVKFLR